MKKELTGIYQWSLDRKKINPYAILHPLDAFIELALPPDEDLGDYNYVEAEDFVEITVSQGKKVILLTDFHSGGGVLFIAGITSTRRLTNSQLVLVWQNNGSCNAYETKHPRNKVTLSYLESIKEWFIDHLYGYSSGLNCMGTVAGVERRSELLTRWGLVPGGFDRTAILKKVLT